MPVVIPETSIIVKSRRQRNHDQDQHQQQPILQSDPIPSIMNSIPSNPTISSLLFPTSNPSTSHKKKNFPSGTFRGLGCAASSQVSVPSVIRTSANWGEAKKVKKKKQKGKKNRDSTNVGIGGEIVSAPSNANGIISNYNASSSSLAFSSSCVAVPDVWCGTGIGLTTDAASVDCVVSRRPNSGRGKVDGDKSHRERPSCSIRRMVTPEENPFIDNVGAVGIPHARSDAYGSRHHRSAQIQNDFSEGLAEIVMLQSSLLLGGRLDGLDRYRDLRLDVDNMSYEELLELGDRIGYVSTGLREDEINCCLRNVKASVRDNISFVIPERERKCSICQEEFEADDEMGKLKCGHFYHIQCIKQWLLHKNACPICKTVAKS